MDREELKEAFVKSAIRELFTGVPETQYNKVRKFRKFKQTVMEEIPTSNAVEACFSFSDKYVYIYLWRNICMNL